jgi:hypothetical protein
MSSISVDLDSVQVTDGQGVGEGDFELRIVVLESVPLTGYVQKVIWPSSNTTRKVNSNGTPFSIGSHVGTYNVTSGISKKTFLVQVTEDDTGTLGQDEFGQQSIVFDLMAGMSRTERCIPINLNNRGHNEGQVFVTMSAHEV